MHYVYIINSINFPDQFYTGYSEDPVKRLDDHNSGKSIHTSKFKPWKLITHIAFGSKEKAMAFEAYLKTGSGRAFSARHFK